MRIETHSMEQDVRKTGERPVDTHYETEGHISCVRSTFGGRMASIEGWLTGYKWLLLPSQCCLWIFPRIHSQ